MKKLLFFACLMGIVFGPSSCSNDFDLIDTWKDIPVVYALLSPQDTAHYIRLEKAFLDENTSAFETAQIADSIYYPDAVVSLVRKSNDQEYFLTRVDGNLEGYQRDEGIFADDPNYLYKLKLNGITDSLRLGENYELRINRGDDLPLVTGESRIVGALDIKEPGLGQVLSWKYDQDVDFRFRIDDRETAIFFNMGIDIHYTEGFPGDEVDKVIEWNFGGNITNEDDLINIEYKIPGESFYTTIAANVDASINTIRKIKFLDFKVTAGGQEIYDYIQVAQVNTGITGSQLIPNFTNMSEGYGIFSSTNSTNRIHLIDGITRDSLENGIYTRNLGFE